MSIHNSMRVPLLSAPVDNTASLVTGKGPKYTPDKKFGTQLHWKTKPPTKLFSTSNANEVDLTGESFGRLEIVGVYDDPRTGHGIKRRGYHWVVRCSCGAYETRTTKSVKRGMTGEKKYTEPAMCSDCQHVVHLRQRAEYLAYGRKT